MSLRYMLDTNASDAVIKGFEPTASRVKALSLDQWCISSITAAEHHFGLAKNPALRIGPVVRAYLRTVHVAPWDERAAEQLGPLRWQLQSTGQTIGSYDTLIAAHALAKQLILVTANVSEFSRVPGLHLENWQAQTG